MLNGCFSGVTWERVTINTGASDDDDDDGGELNVGIAVGTALGIDVGTALGIDVGTALKVGAVNIKVYRVVIMRNHTTSLSNDIISIINNSID